MELIDNDQIISVSEKAITQIGNIVKSQSPTTEQVLRVSVIGGGCSGLSYKIEFGEAKDNDNFIQLDEIKLAIDPKSSIYLKGTILDYQDGLEGKGFVFNNPNAKNTCGCGESFTI